MQLPASDSNSPGTAGKTGKDTGNVLHVIRRDGKIVAFEAKKILNAVHKAFLSQRSTASDVEKQDIVQSASVVTESVVKTLLSEASGEQNLDIEYIQDQVEAALMQAGEYKIARAYILYREQRHKIRLKIDACRSNLVNKISFINVIKRNGRTKRFSLEKIFRKVLNHSKSLNIDPTLIVEKTMAGLFDGITTQEIVTYLAETTASLAIEHPDYSILAANIKIDSLHKSTPGFVDTTQRLYEDGLLSQEYYNKVMNNASEITRIINYQLDYKFDYFALVTLLKLYLLQIDGQVAERPQDMWMRVAITCSCDNFEEDKVRKTYDMLSKGVYIHATPTLFNSGLKMQQLSSCFLVAMEDDSIEGIFNTLKDVALISKSAGGIGINTHNIRCKGSIIKSTNGKSNGLIPFLKIFNETARSVDQGGGKRKGAFAIYLEPWHADIEDFLDLRRNTGAEEFRARDLFYALWIPDLFMQRVLEDGNWTLMSEQTCPGLSEVYAEDFNTLYESYEARGMGIKTLKAQDLMSRIIETQIETGQPYMLYKDAVNKKSNQKNIGVIKSSNLCAEIVEYSDKDETAVCNLASIALPSFVNADKSFNYDALYEVAKLATRNLDRVIDINSYPTQKARRSNERNRPIGLGVQGLADVFFIMRLPYGSKKARSINQHIFETIYFGATEASMEMAQEKGTYPAYEGSPISQGIFQFDLWDVKPSRQWDWDILRKNILKYGVRNSLTTACMPTASTGIILGNTETFQIQTSNIYKRQTLSGEFLLVNRYLVKELINRNLWNKKMRDAIILANGSVESLEDFPQELKPIFKTVWEFSQKTVIDMAADRAPFIDQSQSMNLWLAEPTFAKLSSMHIYAWKKGLKTGMYYLRSRPAVNAVKITVASEEYNAVESGQAEKLSQTAETAETGSSEELIQAVRAGQPSEEIPAFEGGPPEKVIRPDEQAGKPKPVILTRQAKEDCSDDESCLFCGA